MEPILLIMAAGMGSRYGGNKQIDPITEEGDIIMDFSLYDAYQAGFRRVCFVIKQDFEETFKEHIEARAGKYFETMYVHQKIDDLPEGYEIPEGRTKPWGTGHAVLSAREVIDAPFAVINADDYYGKAAFEKIFEYLRNSADASHHCMVGFRIENTLSENGTVSRGICKEENGLLVDIEEHVEVGYDSAASEAGAAQVITGIDTAGVKQVIDSKAPVSMNLWGFDKVFMGSLAEQFRPALDKILVSNPMKGEFYLPSAIDHDIKAGIAKVTVLRSDDKWFGVTYKEDKPLVVAKFKEMKDSGVYPKDLWK